MKQKPQKMPRQVLKSIVPKITITQRYQNIRKSNRWYKTFYAISKPCRIIKSFLAELQGFFLVGFCLALVFLLFGLANYYWISPITVNTVEIQSLLNGWDADIQASAYLTLNLFYVWIFQLMLQYRTPLPMRIR